MRAHGITYDTGFIPTGRSGPSTREPFDPAAVGRDMRVLRDELGCTAVRVTGGDPDRLEVAARHAAAAGLEVWFSPFTCDVTAGELLEVLADCAGRAERLRREGAEVVMVTGAELSLFTKGFLPGDTIGERMAGLARPGRAGGGLAALAGPLNDLLGTAAATVRERFGGRVSYAALPTEAVDWTPFDLVAVDAYRAAGDADRYAAGIRALVASGKPVAVTEFGCATHRGAADRGGRGGLIVNWDDPDRPRLAGAYVRDETEQVTYLRELLDLFTAEGVDTAFWCTFASYHLPHRADPAEDLDMASFGVVKVLEDGTGWAPKAAFAAMAEAYRGA